MSSTRRIPILALTAALLAVGACDDTTGPGSAPSGSLDFTYSGSLSGTYSASGRYGEDDTGRFLWREFAVGFRYFDTQQGEDLVDLFSASPRNSSRIDALDLFIPQVNQPTTLSLDLEACLLDPGALTVREGCAIGLFLFDVTTQLNAGELWVTQTGSLRVESVSGNRMRGTFSGTLVNENDLVVTVTNGSFDVPLVNRSDVSVLSRAPVPGGAFTRAEVRAAAARLVEDRG